MVVVCEVAVMMIVTFASQDIMREMKRDGRFGCKCTRNFGDDFAV